MTTYLDANATEPLRPHALEAMVSAACLDGNPASVHGAGRAARKTLEEARAVLAGAFGAAADDVVFTSGGTEASALAIHAFAASGAARFLYGATEHDAVRMAVLREAATAGRNAAPLAVNADGMLCLEGLAAALARPASSGSDITGPALVCVMAANNETGVLHPLREISALCAAAGAWLHVDAVQVAGRAPVTLESTGADSLAVSGHKFGGPKGAGAWISRAGGAGTPVRSSALIAGGGQERGRRGGTPPLPAIAGMAAALTAAMAQDRAPIASWRERIEAAARSAGARVAGADAPRLDNTMMLVLDGARAQTQLMTLDLAGYAVSAGSACSSGKVSASHVLDAMGYGAAASEGIRVSLPWNADQAAIDGFIAAYDAMAARLGGRMRADRGNGGVA